MRILAGIWRWEFGLESDAGDFSWNPTVRILAGIRRWGFWLESNGKDFGWNPIGDFDWNATAGILAGMHCLFFAWMINHKRRNSV